MGSPASRSYWVHCEVSLGDMKVCEWKEEGCGNTYTRTSHTHLAWKTCQQETKWVNSGFVIRVNACHHTGLRSQRGADGEGGVCKWRGHKALLNFLKTGARKGGKKKRAKQNACHVHVWHSTNCRCRSVTAATNIEGFKHFGGIASFAHQYQRQLIPMYCLYIF